MKKLVLSFALALCLCNNAHAQGLIGAPPEARFGRSDTQTIQADRRYEQWQAGSLVFTAIASALGVCFSAYLLRKHGKAAIGKATLIAVAAPTCSHLLGTVVVNNMWRWF